MKRWSEASNRKSCELCVVYLEDYWQLRLRLTCLQYSSPTNMSPSVIVCVSVCLLARSIVCVRMRAFFELRYDEFDKRM